MRARTDSGLPRALRNHRVVAEWIKAPCAIQWKGRERDTGLQRGRVEREVKDR